MLRMTGLVDLAVLLAGEDEKVAGFWQLRYIRTQLSVRLGIIRLELDGQTALTPSPSPAFRARGAIKQYDTPQCEVRSVAQGSPGYLGPYRLLNVVHTGHAGQIWQAYDDAHQRIVGIKTLLEKARKDREQLHYMHVEYAVGSKLKHPHVIETYSLDTDRGQPYLAMEWFSAPNMKQRLLQNGKGMARLIPKIIDQAADALAYFNQLGWVHRDIKPDNFLVADDGTVKLIDFALAKRARHGLLKWFSRRSKIQGTKSYMSPEQIRGQALDGRADLYSFACTVYELVSGKPPFTGSSVNDLLNKHLKQPPPSLEAAQPNVTTAFSQLIRKSMAKDPNARPKSVGDFLQEFRMIRVFRVTPTGNS